MPSWSPSVTIDSLSGFVEVLSETNYEENWLFRGHGNETWPLIPSIARIRPVADTIRGAERAMMEEFKRFAVPYLRSVPRTEWEWLALAQHYGVPTRMLDWTTNPLAALFFAVAEPVAADSAVWSFRYSRSHRTEGVDPYSIEEVYILRPTHASSRIIGQSGYFTVHPIPLRPFDPRRDQKEKLLQIVIPHAQRPRLRSELDRVGVNYSSLFPDLDGVARHIRWRATVMEDEESSGERRAFGGRVDLSGKSRKQHGN